MNQALKQQAYKEWLKFEKATVEAYHFRPDSKMDAGAFQKLLDNGDDKKLKGLIAWLQQETEKVSKMKFLGEP
jgi:hypothetical protein